MQSIPCNPGAFCPTGLETRICSNGQWGAYGQCTASLKYYGDGGKYCGATVCIQIQASGSNTTLTATISKADNSLFANNSDVTIFSPTTGLNEQFGCLSTAGLSSFQVAFSPSQLGMNSLGGMWQVNAQVLSPCAGGANYISGNGDVSQCE